MDFPYPFNNAKQIRPDNLGRIALLDEENKVLAYLPLDAAFNIAPYDESVVSPYGDSQGRKGAKGFGTYGDASSEGNGLGCTYYGQPDGSYKR
jgi:hypothetical protein